ncbi:hypothetical protein [Zobellella iuensis]|uniref:Solute-binding protein family 3/N-terminal domain-containing protein n=1 Tax=Zobellella iuensis TaxID=2803811 RepID=A0ABS1QQ72_9GAMM|nr:hypothetical protein [Zobellella iuensis]MBL1377023.1 hypothetical protein [Zobellella iuensis]
MNKMLLLLLALFSLPAQARLAVNIPQPEQAPPHHDYYRQVLTLALEKSGEPFTINPVPLNESQFRIAQMLFRGTPVNLAWMGTSSEYEQKLLPVRVPLMRGLSGFRVLIINQSRQQEFSLVQSLAELAAFTGVQGIGWSDIEVLKGAGLNISAARRVTILDMLNRNQHVDYYPRSPVEAFGELAAQGQDYPQLMIEPRLLLHYPFAVYFFVSPEAPRLAEALQRGLERAYSDGSFMALFERHPLIRTSLQQLQLEQRLRLELVNPDLTEATRALPDHYWHPGARP